MNIIFQKFLTDPLNVGAIKESSESSAKKIATIVNGSNTKTIVEVGSGTGILSKFIKNKKLILVEQDKKFCQILQSKYSKHKIVNGCGIQYLKSRKKSYGLFTSIPLIKKSSKDNLINLINNHIDLKILDWFIILGYRYEDSFKDINFKNKKRSFVLNNLPPAFIWHYY